MRPVAVQPALAALLASKASLPNCMHLFIAALHQQGYDAYGAVLYIMVAVTWACLAGCGWVAYKFSKDGVVTNKW